jgi:type IV pilus assembly protein PilM
MHPVTSGEKATPQTSPILPPSAPVAAVRCVQCDSQNAIDRRYCSSCGQPLYEKCPECHTQNALAEAFCGTCGVDLARLFEQRKSKCETAFRDSERMEAELQLEEAIFQLRPLLRISEPRLLAYAEQAKRRTEALRQSQAEWQERCRVACEEARQLERDHDYEGAAARLQEIPTRLRDEACCRLLAQVQMQHEDTKRLARTIRELLEAGRWRELAPPVERLLVLKPQHRQARELATKLRDRFLRASDEKLAAGDYSGSIDLLDEIPREHQDAEVAQRREKYAELDWLHRDLKRSAVVDATLIRVGARLTKAFPADTETSRLLKEARRRLDKPPADPRLAAADWYAPDPSALGIPVDWFAHPQRFGLQPPQEAILRKYPGSFSVAFGLALQGIESAAVDTNFVPRDTGRVLDKISFLRRKTSGPAWGIDIGSTSLKAVRLLPPGSDGQVQIDRIVYQKHEQSWKPTTDEENVRERTQGALKRFLEKCPLQDERICLGIPGRVVLGRFFQPPPVEAKKLEEVVRYEAGVQIPIPLDELAWNYHAFEYQHDPTDTTATRFIALQAVKLHHVQQLLANCEEVGLKPDILQSDFMALHNLAQFEFAETEPESTPGGNARVLLDLGASGGNLVVSSPQGVWFRNFGVGGQVLTSALTQELKLTREQAELLKHEPSRARRLRGLYELLDPALGQIYNEVKRSLSTCEQVAPQIHPTRVLGMGGAFATHALLRVLRTGETTCR